jgi:hypothetical protein
MKDGTISLNLYTYLGVNSNDALPYIVVYIYKKGLTAIKLDFLQIGNELFELIHKGCIIRLKQRITILSVFPDKGGVITIAHHTLQIACIAELKLHDCRVALRVRPIPVIVICFGPGEIAR